MYLRVDSQKMSWLPLLFCFDYCKLCPAGQWPCLVSHSSWGTRRGFSKDWGRTNIKRWLDCHFSCNNFDYCQFCPAGQWPCLVPSRSKKICLVPRLACILSFWVSFTTGTGHRWSQYVQSNYEGWYYEMKVTRCCTNWQCGSIKTTEPPTDDGSMIACMPHWNQARIIYAILEKDRPIIVFEMNGPLI